MSTLADQTASQLNELRNGEMSKRVSGVVNMLTDQVVGAAKSADGFVRSSPWQAVGAVALAGLAAGMLVSRRSRRTVDGVQERADRDSSEACGG